MAKVFIALVYASYNLDVLRKLLALVIANAC